MRIIEQIREIPLVIARQRGHLFPWVPVFLGVGIGIYFCLKFEPNNLHYALLLIGIAVLGVATLRVHENLAPFCLAIALIFFGVTLAGFRSHAVSEPVLTFRYYGPIQGRITKIDRSVSEAVRLTLDRVALDNMSPQRTPNKIRVSLHGPQDFLTPEIGKTVILTGHLSPPSGPVEPGGFNFRKMAWFQGLGGVGYTRSPVLELLPAQTGKTGLFISRLRRSISQSVQSEIKGEEGAFAAAILTGDRSDMSHAALQSLRNSNLAHLLAISGLHMGMLTGFVFAATRLLFSLFPSPSMRLPVKKIAAVVALVFGGGYLALSGGNVATVRAFVMVSVMLLAILMNRKALTLRAVAIAAIIILVLEPESLTGPGFQMSFAATVALVAVFSNLRATPNPRVPKPLRVAFGVTLSSFIAGMATAPVAAVHFNQIAQYGLIANVVTVPLMGVLVMPAAVVSALLVPFGLHWIGLSVMQWGIWWILSVATWISGLENAIRLVITPHWFVLPLMATGALFLFIWQGRGRFIGLPIVAVAFFYWAQTQRPDILISDSGTLIGVMSNQGRALNRGKGSGFVADSWLENDGDATHQQDAFARNNFEISKGFTRVEHNNMSVALLSGKKTLKRVVDICRETNLVITNQKSDAVEGCAFIDIRRLRRVGSMAINSKTGEVVTAQEFEGQRIWSPRQKY